MSIAEFIATQALTRASAAQSLIEPLEINGIKITAGCDEHGIEVESGIEKLAEILDVELKVEDEDYKYDEKMFRRKTTFIVGGTTFYKVSYVKKEDNGNERED